MEIHELMNGAKYPAYVLVEEPALDRTRASLDRDTLALLTRHSKTLADIETIRHRISVHQEIGDLL